MKRFGPAALDLAACVKEVEEFRTLLERNVVLKERKDILPFFKSRPQLSAMCGPAISPKLARADRLAPELDLFGDFACDLAVGDWHRKSYCLVEFEDAGPGSIFRRGRRRASPEWSLRFERGYSQCVDWLRKLALTAESEDFETLFGARAVTYDAALVIGRRGDMSQTELNRLQWRRDKVVVDSRHIVCLTFDDLLDLIYDRINTLRLMLH